jgi:hypothetical protein
MLKRRANRGEFTSFCPARFRHKSAPGVVYRDEPRKLVFIGILNDTDQTGQETVSYIADVKFHRK